MKSNKINQFEDIIAWQKAKELTLLIYKLFNSTKDYSFRDQIQRASVSVMNNIAEGFERKSNKDFCNFLFIACGEVRSMSHLALELNYISKEDYTQVAEKSIVISKMLSGFIKTL